MASTGWLLSVLTIITFTECQGFYHADGESCMFNDLQGICRPIAECKSAWNAVTPNKFQLCPFDLYKTLVCCADEVLKCSPYPADEIKIKKNGRGTAHDHCIDWYELMHPCGKNGTRPRKNFCSHTINQLSKVGIEKANDQEFPHMVLVGFETNKTFIYTWECSGALISERWVLTSASCMESSKRKVSAIRIRVKDVGEFVYAHNVFLVGDPIAHPKHVKGRLNDDLALLRMSEPLTFSKSVLPVCLHLGDSVDSGRAMASGWNLKVGNYIKEINGTLMKATLDELPNRECMRTFQINKIQDQSIDNRTQVCYGMKNKTEIMCLGMNGAPIQIHNKYAKCTYTLLGIGNRLDTCGVSGSPVIFTRVAPYLSWIERVVWPVGKDRNSTF